MTIVNDIGAGLNGVFADRRHKPAAGMRRDDREQMKVYVRRACLTALLGWAFAGLYLLITPAKYVSKWTLILPGAGHSATMSIESVGQATTTAASPFGSVSLSPKVVYREIADSDGVRKAAAEISGMTFEEFGRPRIKLIDETALMNFEIGASTPEGARRKANASIKALDQQLEALRNDELNKRSVAVTRNLQSYQAEVHRARDHITEVQLSSGLVSINQFNEIVTTLGTTRRRLTDLIGEVGKLREEQASLVARIGIEPDKASIALRLAGNPAFAKLVTEFSDANGLYSAQMQYLGPANPVMVGLDKRRSAARENLNKLVSKLNLGTASSSEIVVLMTNVSHQAELLTQLVRNESAMVGKRQELDAMTAEKDRLEAEITKLSSVAAKLEDLKKDHLLAEAVYSSALARVDTSKSDIYGAYPILQVLAQPTLPVVKEQPRLTYALAGGVAATVFSFLTWGLAWLHYLQTTRRRKKPSSTG